MSKAFQPAGNPSNRISSTISWRYILVTISPFLLKLLNIIAESLKKGIFGFLNIVREFFAV